MKILTKNDVEIAGTILRNDGIVAFPTETVYGLGILSTSYTNFQHLVEVKNRQPDKPFTMMISNLSQVENYVEINQIAKKIIEKFMPGPLTIIVKAKENIPEYIDYRTGFVGLRMPKDDFVLKLIDYNNEALFVPSCNKADKAPCKNTYEVVNEFNNEIEAVIDGCCENGVPSTIIKIDNDKVSLIRKGELSIEEIMEALK